MNELRVVDTAQTMVGPTAGHLGPADTRMEHRRCSRNYFEILFVDEGKFGVIHGVVAEPDAKRIEHHVFLDVGERLWFALFLKNAGIINRHASVSWLMSFHRCSRQLGAWFVKIMVLAAENHPPTPWQTEIFAPWICAG